MTVYELTRPTAAQEQEAAWNQAIGGAANRQATFSVPADVAWAVVGCVLADAVTVGDMPTLVSAIEALSEVTSVNGDQFYGQAEGTIETAGREFVLHVTARSSATIGGGIPFTESVQKHNVVKPPLGKKWSLFVMRLPSQPDASDLTALDSAITGITGVTSAHNLVDGYTSSRQVGNANLTVAAHLRLDPVEV